VQILAEGTGAAIRLSNKQGIEQVLVTP